MLTTGFERSRCVGAEAPGPGQAVRARAAGVTWSQWMQGLLRTGVSGTLQVGLVE